MNMHGHMLLLIYKNALQDSQRYVYKANYTGLA